jgi:predicted metal-binding membrane protein
VAATDADSGLVRALRQDRVIIALGLTAITLLAWAYLVRMAVMIDAAAMDAEMPAAMGMPDMRAWDLSDLLVLFLMWAIMMVGMMLPSATPIILLVVVTYRRRGHQSRALTSMFASGYLAAWTAFSAAAALLQLVLHRAGLLSADMASRSVVLGGGILLAAGIYQWLPLKNACLTSY